MKGPYLAEQLDRYDTVDQTTRVLGLIRQALTCTQWTETDDQGTSVTWHLTSLAPGNVGQAEVAVRTTASAPTPVTVDVVYVQEGGYLLSLAYLSSSTPAAGTLNLYLRQADARLRQALG